MAPPPVIPPASPRKPSLIQQVGLPAMAGSLAVCFTHPLELTKIRLQLDNELAQRGTPRKYTGFVDCIKQNWTKGGVRGLQGGLMLGITREFFFNGIRIGSFDSLVGGVHTVSGREGVPSGDEKLIAGLTAGALGGMCINPIDVAKTRAQAKGGLTGHQHSSAGGYLSSLKSLKDEGLRGMFRGVGTNTMRGFLGPGSQIVAYTLFKEKAGSLGYSVAHVGTHVTCSLASAAVSVACVNPADVIRTRLFNQPFDTEGKGLWYRNGFHAGMKVVSVEGPTALYKGAGANLLRLGPHMVLVFVFLEQFKKMAAS